MRADNTNSASARLRGVIRVSRIGGGGVLYRCADLDQVMASLITQAAQEAWQPPFAAAGRS